MSIGRELIREDSGRPAEVKSNAQDSYTECVIGILRIDKSIDKCLTALKKWRSMWSGREGADNS
jgi:hypothetical protein